METTYAPHDCMKAKWRRPTTGRMGHVYPHNRCVHPYVCCCERDLPRMSTAATNSVTITISKAAADGKSQPKSQSNQYQFKFDGVLHDASQEEVYEVRMTGSAAAGVPGVETA
ncbi:hypothetical protein HaLaN_26122, partial [Haematococcus lacustris]